VAYVKTERDALFVLLRNVVDGWLKELPTPQDAMATSGRSVFMNVALELVDEPWWFAM
jgi:hypothetical protein